MSSRMSVAQIVVVDDVLPPPPSLPPSPLPSPLPPLLRHPGYSMFDWNRLCQKKGQGQMSATAGGRLLKITPAELAKHNSETDLWTAVRGELVYIVCTYVIVDVCVCVCVCVL